MLSFQTQISVKGKGGGLAKDGGYDKLPGESVPVADTDNETRGKVRIQNGFTTLSGDEGSQATVTLIRENGSAGIATVEYTVASGSSKDADWADNSGLGGTVEFGDGITTRNIVIDIVQDTWLEADETFTVTIADPDGTEVEDQVVVPDEDESLES